ncbi:sigma 54-interacting transcriptional regulator [Salinibacter altiplanensis]|uniref:sigma 54-interacting transcriptional regulator n=1 Tax=Salinibacter altiplanensis TaxID=1803181 RepID=UPI000C9F8310|nr:sigma 54-interacting transcriptional regulator [Salinibacter altiplanensis]
MRTPLPTRSTGDGSPPALTLDDTAASSAGHSAWRELRRSALCSPVPTQSPKPLVGDSEAIRRGGDLADTAAQNSLNLLVQGESGVGKSRVAQRVHAQSDRRMNWLVVVNCELIGAEDLEALLLGTMSSAEGSELGSLIGIAAGGTLVLDRIGALDPSAQARLDHILETHSFPEADGPSPSLGVRLISTVTSDPSTGEFRRRLYDRLSQFSIRIPPLRDRPDDILPLARHFLRHHAGCESRDGHKILTADAEAVLRQHTWPGNVRELKNAVERAANVGDTSVVRADDLSLSVHDAPASEATRGDADGDSVESLTPSGGSTDAAFSMDDMGSDGTIPTIEEMKREAVERAYEACDHDVDHAAVELGIGRSTMYRLLKRYDLK